MTIAAKRAIMQIKEAKDIPLYILVEHLGGRYSHTDAHDNLWYFSVFRPDEKTASFKINPKTNKWHDFGLTGIIRNQNKLSSGGDCVDLWNDFHQRDRREGIKKSLDDLQRFSTNTCNHAPPEKAHAAPAASKPIRYKILKTSDRITHPALKDELYRRRISPRLAQIYLKQGFILDTATEKKYTGFLFENDKGGYEVSIPNPTKAECFKTCIGPKSSTTFQPSQESTSTDVFEGFWDFLSWMEIKKIQLPGNYSVVLNSVSFTSEASEKILRIKEQITSVFLFMDNDAAGEASTHELALLLEPEILCIGDMRAFYNNHKDLGRYWEQKNSIKLRP